MWHHTSRPRGTIHGGVLVAEGLARAFCPNSLVSLAIMGLDSATLSIIYFGLHRVIELIVVVIIILVVFTAGS